MFRADSIFRRVAGFVAIVVMVMAGLASAHARTHVPSGAVVEAAPCHEQAKKDPCKEICASGLPDHVLADAMPVVRTADLVTPVVYEIPKAVFVPSHFASMDGLWRSPPSQGLPAVLRHQRLLI